MQLEGHGCWWAALSLYNALQEDVLYLAQFMKDFERKNGSNKMKLRRTDEQGYYQQLHDGRKPFSAIAEELSITENTVRARVNKLIDEGVLEISGLVNPEMIPGLQVVMMGVKLKTLDLEKKAKEFALLRGVISAAVVTGRYDLIVQLCG